MNVDNLKNPLHNLHNLCKPTLEISHHSLQSSTVRVGTYGCENTIYEFAEDGELLQIKLQPTRNLSLASSHILLNSSGRFFVTLSKSHAGKLPVCCKVLQLEEARDWELRSWGHREQHHCFVWPSLYITQQQCTHCGAGRAGSSNTSHRISAAKTSSHFYLVITGKQLQIFGWSNSM